MPAIFHARSAALLPLMLAGLLIATMLALAPSADAAASRRAQKISTGFDVVRHQTGDPYNYGSAGPSAFDCSGLIYYSFRKAGFKNVPRTASQQAGHMNRIGKGQLRRGDFVFFHRGSASAGNVYHVGVFAGLKDGRRTIIHAPYGNNRVHREKIWTNQWFPGTLRGL